MSESRISFESILERYHGRIYNLVYRLLSDQDEAADVTQETFVKAYRAYNSFDGPSNAVYPWLCRIAVNNCRNRFRDLGRRQQYEAFSLDTPVDGTDGEFEPEVGDDSMDPAGVFERRELSGLVQDSIMQLPPDYRVVVVLRDVHGLSYKEIADACGLTLDLVKVRLYRGREILRRRLAPYISD